MDFRNPHTHLERGLVVCDALYVYCRQNKQIGAV
jgi:hypothetical protein